MQHSPLLRAAARAICDARDPGEEWTPVGVDKAERLGRVPHKQAADAARQTGSVFASRGDQLPLVEEA